MKVWLNDPAKYVCTYAFIDEGSSVSLRSKDLANRLGVPIIQSNVELTRLPRLSVRCKD